MYKVQSLAVAIFLLFSTGIFPVSKNYKGLYISVMKDKKFENEKFKSVIFGSISIYNKKKREKKAEAVQIFMKHGNSKNEEKLSLFSNEYFVLQSIPGTITIDRIFYKKRYFKIERKLTVGKGNLVYAGDIKLRRLKSTLEKYSYEVNINTNFKKLKFRSNMELKSKLNSNCPIEFLRQSAGKILIPIYIPSQVIKYEEDFTPFETIGNGDYEALKKFIKKGIDINIVDSNGWSLLMKSLESKQKDISGYLLKKDVDIKMRTPKGWTALMFALEYNDLDIAKKLVEMGADVKASLSKGWSVLFFAMRYGSDVGLLDKLIEKGVDINRAKGDGWTPLMMALCYRDEAISMRLLEKGAKFIKKDNEDWTPLMYALRYGKNRAAIYMIERGADINAVNKNGWTPLLFALRNNMKEPAALLIKKKAEITKANRDGFTPLHLALEYDFEDIAMKIIETGKTINIKTRYGWTPLMYATRYGKRKAAHFLLDRGADISGMTKDGWTTLHLALRYDQPKTSLRIIKRGKLDLNKITNEGWSPLLMALRYNQPDSAKLLIKKRANINLANKNGWTPLMIAIKYDQPEIAEILIKKGALKEIKNRNGKSALDIAKEKEYFNLFTLLGGENFPKAKSFMKAKAGTLESPGLKGVWGKIIPLTVNSQILSSDNCLESSALCHAKVEYNISKAETMRFIIDKLKAAGYKYDKQLSARSERGSLKNRNIWGLVNFTNNSTTHVISVTVIILSDYKSGTTKTVADFNRVRSARKMRLKF